MTGFKEFYMEWVGFWALLAHILLRELKEFAIGVVVIVVLVGPPGVMLALLPPMPAGGLILLYEVLAGVPVAGYIALKLEGRWPCSRTMKSSKS